MSYDYYGARFYETGAPDAGAPSGARRRPQVREPRQYSLYGQGPNYVHAASERYEKSQRETYQERYLNRKPPRRVPPRGVLAAVAAVLVIAVIGAFASGCAGSANGAGQSQGSANSSASSDGAQASAATSSASSSSSDGSSVDSGVTKTTTSAGAISVTRTPENRSATSASTNGYSCAPKAKTVYLTFDDGPSQETEKILQILNRYGVHATWFVVGNRPQLNLVKEIWDDGNQVGLHSMTHDYSTDYASTDSYLAGLDKVNDELQSYLGFKPTLLRFPGGSVNSYDSAVVKGTLKNIKARQWHYFDWNVENGDATGNDLPADTLVANVKKEAKGTHSCCVLMHDLETKSTTVEALPRIIQYFIDHGYTFDVLTASSCGYHF